MGVDFYTCKACKRTFPDCGPHERCDEEKYGCGAVFCSDRCARIEGPENEEEIDYDDFEALPEEDQAPHRQTCIDCRKELESNENLLNFQLELIGKTRAELLAEFRAARTAPKSP